MPLPTTPGQSLSMSEIIAEKQGDTTARTNVSLRGLSVDGVADSSGGDITGTPDGNAPYAISEFSGYTQFAWGTPGSITTNATYPFNGYQEERNGGDTEYVTACNMTLNTSTKAITFTFTNTDGPGGFNVNIGSTNTTTISYTGTLSSLEARFLYSGAEITASGTTGREGKVTEIFSNNDHLSQADISGVSFATGHSITSSNDISSGASGTYRSLRTTSGNMSAALVVAADDTSSNEGSIGRIKFTGSDSLKVQLRANGSKVVDLYTRIGTFEMEAQGSDEDTS